MDLPNGFRAIPLYRERYQLLTTKDSPLAQRETVTWEMVSRLPLCLLTPDTENRRIIEGLLRATGENPSIMVGSDSISVLFAHVRTGAWASIVPDKIAQSTRISDRDLKRSRSSSRRGAHRRPGDAGARPDHAARHRARQRRRG